MSKTAKIWMTEWAVAKLIATAYMIEMCACNHFWGPIAYEPGDSDVVRQLSREPAMFQIGL